MLSTWLCAILFVMYDNNLFTMHTMTLVIVTCAFTLVTCKITKNGYCNICADHTMCKFPGLGEACKGSKDGGITKKEKQLIVDMHNAYRKKLAKGQVKGAKGLYLPKASNMMKMKWDDELQKVAQRWADQCTYHHDTCRNDPRWSVGQNIYKSYNFPFKPTVNWSAAMKAWFNEVKIYHPNLIGHHVANPEIGHFTQMVWHDTVNIGCGRRTYGLEKIYVCNYGPAGNWLSLPVYNRGEPCSKCPKEAPNCDDGLCKK